MDPWKSDRTRKKRTNAWWPKEIHYEAPALAFDKVVEAAALMMCLYERLEQHLSVHRKHEVCECVLVPLDWHDPRDIELD
jgi:hypothetical protein